MGTVQTLTNKVIQLEEMLRVAMLIQGDATANDYSRFVLTRGGTGDFADAYEFIKQHPKFKEANNNEN